MHISSLKLAQFRNYHSLDLDFSPGTTTLVGQNAQGKTNILEALWMLVLGKSFRTADARELIEHGHDFCRVDGMIVHADRETRIEVIIDDRERLQKRVKIEGVSHRASGLAGVFHAVLFVPDDLNIIGLSPSYRRSHLDTTLAQVSTPYASALTQYSKVMRNRNKLLEAIREGSSSEDELPYWDEQLVKLATTIVSQRLLLIKKYKASVGQHYHALSKETGDITISYHACVEHPQEVAQAFAEKIAVNRERDIAAALTTSGPHREDFTISLNERDIASFGSRGEQRSALLALKIAEIEFIKEHTGKTPVLLLDDVFSELDESRRVQLFEIAAPDQIIITTTDESHAHPSSTVLHVVDGAVE